MNSSSLSSKYILNYFIKNLLSNRVHRFSNIQLFKLILTHFFYNRPISFHFNRRFSKAPFPLPRMNIRITSIINCIVVILLKLLLFLWLLRLFVCLYIMLLLLLKCPWLSSSHWSSYNRLGFLFKFFLHNFKSFFFFIFILEFFLCSYFGGFDRNIHSSSRNEIAYLS